MKRTALLLGSIAVFCLVTACSSSSDNHAADVQAIKNLEAQWNQDYAARDADKLAAHYTNNAVLAVPGTETLSGRDAIQRSMTQMVADPALSLKFQPSKVEVAKSGDLAFTEGSYTLTVTDRATKKPIDDFGSYMTAYRKLPDGTWKAVADIATSQKPMAPPPAARSKKPAKPGKHARRAGRR